MKDDKLRDELEALEAAAALEDTDAEPVDAILAEAKVNSPGGVRATMAVSGWPAETAPGSRPGTVSIKLERFEGPLDLLLHLIKRDEIDIYDIPISHITQQYLAYIELIRALDLDIAGEFLVMAATLMRIKAKMLLPLPAMGEEELPGDPDRKSVV